MRYLVALLAASALVCAQTPATKLITPVQILKKTDNSVGGTLEIQGVTVASVPVAHLHAGQDYINSLVGNVSGKTIWRLGNNPTNYGFLSLSNGTGTGGFDGNGAQIYGDAFGGLLEVMQQIDVGFTDPRVFIRPGQLFTTNGASATINNIDTTGISSTVQVYVGGASSHVTIAPGVTNWVGSDGVTTRILASAGGAGAGLFRTFDAAGTLVNELNAALGLTSTVGVYVGGATGRFTQLTDATVTLKAADGVTTQVQLNNSAGASTGGMIRTFDISGNVINTFNHLGIKSSIFAGSGARCIEADNNGLLGIAAGACASSSGANTALSNLASTAVNAAINPDTDAAYGLGTTSLRWGNVQATTFQSLSSAGGNRKCTLSGGSITCTDATPTTTFTVSSLTGQITAANLAGGGTQCLNADNSGVITGTGSGCAGGFSTSAWSSYTPSTTNLSSVSTTGGKNQSGKTAFFRVLVTGTSNGSTPTISLPFTAATNDQTFACTVALSGATVPCSVVVSSSTMTIHIYDNSAFGNGNVYTFIIAGSMETT